MGNSKSASSEPEALIVSPRELAQIVRGLEKVPDMKILLRSPPAACNYYWIMAPRRPHCLMSEWEGGQLKSLLFHIQMKGAPKEARLMLSCDQTAMLKSCLAGRALEHRLTKSKPGGSFWDFSFSKII